MKTDEVVCCETSYRIMEGVEIRSEKAPLTLDLPKARIVMNYSFKRVCNNWYETDDFRDTELVNVLTLPILRHSIQLSGEQLFSSKARKMISRTIRGWISDKHERLDLIKASVKIARRALSSIPDDRHTLLVEIPLIEEHECIVSEEYKRLCERNLTPASDSSIESLEKKVAEGDGVCWICFKDYYMGSSTIACMPCLHSTFHADCIVNSLKKSHLCPICRYEVPKKEQEPNI